MRVLFTKVQRNGGMIGRSESYMGAEHFVMTCKYIDLLGDFTHVKIKVVGTTLLVVGIVD